MSKLRGQQLDRVGDPSRSTPDDLADLTFPNSIDPRKKHIKRYDRIQAVRGC
jgi:hypothetical protein